MRAARGTAVSTAEGPSLCTVRVAVHAQSRRDVHEQSRRGVQRPCIERARAHSTRAVHARIGGAVHGRGHHFTSARRVQCCLGSRPCKGTAVCFGAQWWWSSFAMSQARTVAAAKSLPNVSFSCRPFISNSENLSLVCRIRGLPSMQQSLHDLNSSWTSRP